MLFVRIAAVASAYKADDEGEVPTSLLQSYQLGKVLYKMESVTVRACEDRCREILYY